MAREDRPTVFLFEPARFLNDEAVQAMIPAALGAYAALFCACWQQQEVGVLTDDDRLLSFLARCTAEEWAAVAPQVRRAFRSEVRDGRPVLVQSGLVETRRAQVRWLDQKSEAGREAAKSRWDKRKDAAGIGSPNATAMQYGLGLVGIREEEPNPSPSLGLGVEAAAPEASKPETSWAAQFDSRFWPAWPSGVRGKPGKAEARELWARLKPKGPDLLEAIMAGLERWKSSSEWRKEGGAFIPDAKKWLRRQRWLDEVGPGAASSSAEAWAREGDGE